MKTEAAHGPGKGWEGGGRGESGVIYWPFTLYYVVCRKLIQCPDNVSGSTRHRMSRPQGAMNGKVWWGEQSACGNLLSRAQRESTSGARSSKTLF